MSWFYTPVYWGLLVICFTQSFYPIFMLLAMLVRQSRLLYAFFHQVDTASKRHGGELVAQVFKAHGVENIFTLPGGHVSPIVVASDKLNIRVVDVRHEATAVFAADASARLTGIPGVAVVTAGPGLTNTVTAIKNAQMAESPVVVVAGAAATMLKNRGSLQDIDQISLLKTATKKCFSIDCVREIIPTLREAFRVAQVGVPGPVLVELPVDILYPYHIIAEQFSSMQGSSSTKQPAKQSLKSHLVNAYTNYSLKHIFADAWKEQDYDSLPVSIQQPPVDDVRRVAEMLGKAKRPLLIVGSQSVLRPHGPESVAACIKRLGVPVYLNGAARGLLGADYGLQFRHARKEAVREADCVLLLGAICDFRLGYGRIFRRGTRLIAVNRSKKAATLNAGIFWQPTLTVECDVGKFVEDLTKMLSVRQQQTQASLQHTGRHSEEDPCDGDSGEFSSGASTGSTASGSPRRPPQGDRQTQAGPLLQVEPAWLEQLRERDRAKDASIESMAGEPTDKHLNPLKLLLECRRTFHKDDTIIVADGGDFVASASYILKPNGPLRWLDPGPFGTLGCGAGFALAAKLLNPGKRVLAILGDGAFGYAAAELDTFVRHNVPVFWLIGNDACWTQIVREQLPMLGSPVGCQLAYTDYHQVARAFGALGFHASERHELAGRPGEEPAPGVLERAKREMDSTSKSVVVNALIGSTKFREGSISV